MPFRSPDSDFLRTLAIGIVDAGNSIIEVDRAAEVNVGEGHRSIQTQADKNSAYIIIETLSGFPEARILCEDPSADMRVVSRETGSQILSGPCGCVVDPLDGTTLFAGGYPDWSVGAGTMTDGRLDGSAIFAPQANGGTLCVSSGTEGVFVSEGFGPFDAVKRLSPVDRKKSVILRGVDTELYAKVLGIMPNVAANVRGVYTQGSGLFGLMSLILGRAAAIIQTPQKAWDWVPAYHALTRVGGVFRFFRICDGDLVTIVSFDKYAFDYAKANRLGFIAGEPGAVDWLFDLLPRSGWERCNPETVQASSIA